MSTTARENMARLAEKLIALKDRESRSHLSSAIFGSVVNLPASLSRRAPVRIGMWPCVSDDDPELVMGLWTTFAYILELWQDITVYRLFVRVGEDVDESYEWQIEHSQFPIEDWQLNDLDENIAISGNVTRSDDSLALRVTLENDLSDEEDSEGKEFSYEARSWMDLLCQLPQIAKDVVREVGAYRRDETLPFFECDVPDVVKLNSERIVSLLRTTFAWERDILLFLWGLEWDDESIIHSTKELEGFVKGEENFVASWIVAQALRRSMLPGLAYIGDLILPQIDSVIETSGFADSMCVLIADSLFEAGYAEKAYQLLQVGRERNPRSSLITVKLANSLARGGRITEAISIIQSALKSEMQSANLYEQYASLLAIVRQYGVPIETLTLIDATTITDAEIVVEAIRAYDLAFALKPPSIRALHRQGLLLLHHDEQRFWNTFQKIIELGGQEQISDLIQSLDEIDDVGPAVVMLQRSIKEEKTLEKLLNLAQVMILNDEEAVHSVLDEAWNLTSTAEDKSQIEQLRLNSVDDTFENRFAELSAMIEAGNSPSGSDVEFLEDVVADAPHFVNAYLTLARAYLIWGDDEAALEVLLDADKLIPSHPDIMERLAEALWRSGEQELAFEYLNRGLEEDPNHVPLLVRVGRYLFDNNQYDDAKLYIARAEVIAPRASELSDLRAYIAQHLSGE